MNTQSESSVQKNENVSELEMVGALLFGSIADESTQTECSQEQNRRGSRKVNLGAKIAPEMSRRWEEEKSESILNTREASMVSELLPESRNTNPVLPREESGKTVNPAVRNAETECTSEETGKQTEVESQKTEVKTEIVKKSVRDSKKRGSWVTRIYGTGLVLLTLCVVVLGWQLFTEKQNNKVQNTVSTSSTAKETLAVKPSEVKEEPTVLQTSESAFAGVQDASVLESPQPLSTPELVEDSLPVYSPVQVESMEEVPVYQAVGSAVVAEEYPSYNSEWTVAPATSVNMNQPSVAPVTDYSQTAEWNAGATMEEIPVFNSEISSFSNVNSPEMVQTTPQVGSQAVCTAPYPVSAPVSIPEQAPRKLVPPTAPQASMPAPVEEEYPSFNPNMGVDGALPVSYY